jgi:hypothetical protein
MTTHSALALMPSEWLATSGCRLRNASLGLQLEVIAWVNNSWETQWISGHASADVGRLEVQVGGVAQKVTAGCLPAKQCDI